MKKDKMTLAIAIFLVAVMMTGLSGSVFAGTKPECNDKIDNDGDGAIDMADAGCVNKGDKDESNCGDGVCEGGETSDTCPADCGPADSCSDTDGGYNTLMFGTTSGYLNQVQYSNDDYCVDADNLNEYYCDGDYEQSLQANCGTDYNYKYCGGQANDSVYQDDIDYFCNYGACNTSVTTTWVEDCEFGCTGGTCDPPPASCSDTDGGWNTDIQGTVSGYLEGGDPYEWTDFCNSTTLLLEYYCNEDSPEGWTWDCSLNDTTSCLNGACV